MSTKSVDSTSLSDRVESKTLSIFLLTKNRAQRRWRITVICQNIIHHDSIVKDLFYLLNPECWSAYFYFYADNDNKESGWKSRHCTLDQVNQLIRISWRIGRTPQWYPRVSSSIMLKKIKGCNEVYQQIILSNFALYLAFKINS